MPPQEGSVGATPTGLQEAHTTGSEDGGHGECEGMYGECEGMYGEEAISK